MTHASDRSVDPAWLTAGATALAYGAVLAVVFALLFGVPYLIATLAS